MADLSNSIHVVNGYDEDAYTYYPVLIVGAGESGIAMACRLKGELGFDQFRIFDRQSGAGGTWWINRYPGVACDMHVFPWPNITIADARTVLPYSIAFPLL